MSALLLSLLVSAHSAEPCSRLRLDVAPGFEVVSIAERDVGQGGELVVEAPEGVLTLFATEPGHNAERALRVALTAGVEHQCAVDERGLVCTRSIVRDGGSPEGALDLCTGHPAAAPPVAPGTLSADVRTAARAVGLEGVALRVAPADPKARVDVVVDVPEQIIPLHLLDQGAVGGRWYYDEHGHVLTKRQVISLLEADAASAQLMKERKTLLGVGATLTALTSVTGGLPLLVGGVICLGAGSERYERALFAYNRDNVAVTALPAARRVPSAPRPEDALDADGDWIGLQDP